MPLLYQSNRASAFNLPLCLPHCIGVIHKCRHDLRERGYGFCDNSAKAY